MFRHLPRFAKNWLPAPAVLLLLAVSALLLLSDDLVRMLRYDRTGIDAGQYWRVLSANLVHSNYWHYLLNAGSVAVQALLFRDLLPARNWGLVALLCAAGNILGMHFFSPELRWYVGMSGALYGSAIFGAIALLRNREWLIGGALASYLTGRIIYEQFWDLPSDMEQMIGVPVAVDAHLWGLLTGYLCCLMLFMPAKIRHSNATKAHADKTEAGQHEVTGPQS